MAEEVTRTRIFVAPDDSSRPLPGDPRVGDIAVEPNASYRVYDGEAWQPTDYPQLFAALAGAPALNLLNRTIVEIDNDVGEAILKELKKLNFQLELITETNAGIV